jgi:hypothetical protein
MAKKSSPNTRAHEGVVAMTGPLPRRVEGYCRTTTDESERWRCSGRNLR